MHAERRFPGKPRVLVAPLDWGLGHATRCVPIIRELIHQGAEVVIAAEGAVAQLLNEEFPLVETIPLKGYRVSYAKTASLLPIKIAFQIPRLFSVIRREHRWLQQVIKNNHIDLVISDNRYGLYSGAVPCIFITHQLSIIAGNKTIEKLIRWFNYRCINRFTGCWIPDTEGPADLAGKLSHAVARPGIPLFYTGVLSRLTATDNTVIPGHLFVSLSGPEPQRSILEDKLIDQLSHYRYSATIVRGLPASGRVIPSTNSLQFFNHLPAGQLGAEMAKAEMVIARSGYSTVMDLAMMGKQAILIPTPGQTEQEYLAGYLMGKGFALQQDQDSFDLEAALVKARGFYYNNRDVIAVERTNRLPELVADLLGKS
ncbi:MAG: glycosyl transferase family 28 [Chitinophagaceae bacterium]|nr:MAG: glycosyl transferase family 28 [Chitinophagaceae bacterium]